MTIMATVKKMIVRNQHKHTRSILYYTVVYSTELFTQLDFVNTNNNNNNVPIPITGVHCDTVIVVVVLAVVVVVSVFVLPTWQATTRIRPCSSRPTVVPRSLHPLAPPFLLSSFVQSGVSRLVLGQC